MFEKPLNRGVINITTIIIIIITILIGGIIARQISKNPKEEKDLNKETVNIPEECQQFQEDICGLFSCMTNGCWCDLSNPVLHESENNILNEEEAMSAVKQYLQNTNSEYKEVRSATKINGFFFNVFAYNAQNEEKVFTIGSNGTILLTICGV